MIERPFFLKPFKQEDALHDLMFTGSINRDINRLTILYELFGPIKELIIPDFSDKPIRMDRLWEETCFELFLNSQNFGTYWEFNLSPSGHWNVYRFNGYRKGMQEEEAFISLPFSVQTGPDILRLAIEFDPETIIPPAQAVNVAVCAVMKEKSGRITYWALTHHGEMPDFHMADSFVIEL
jgi:hypothetical protein